MDFYEGYHAADTSITPEPSSVTLLDLGFMIISDGIFASVAGSNGKTLACLHPSRVGG
jgi:hypothetical protein